MLRHDMTMKSAHVISYIRHRTPNPAMKKPAPEYPKAGADVGVRQMTKANTIIAHSLTA